MYDAVCNLSPSSFQSNPSITIACDALITPSPSLPLELRQNNPQDCSNLIIASVNRATVEISRTIIALNATFSQQLRAASSSATSGINSAQSSANTTISIAFSSVTVANRIATSANLALTTAQLSASTALSIANQSIAVASQSLISVNIALQSAQSNITSVSSASSSDLSRLSSISSTDVSKLSASLTSLQASVSSIQASASVALAAAQLALASVTGSAVAQASAIIASAASATQSQAGPQTVFTGSSVPNGRPITLQSSKITPTQIAAIAVGVVVILLLIIGIIYFMTNKMRKRERHNSYMNEKNFPPRPVSEPGRSASPVVLIPESSSAVASSIPEVNNAASASSGANTTSTKFIPRKSSDTPRPAKSSLRKKRKDSILSTPPGLDVRLEAHDSFQSVGIPILSPGIGVPINIGFGSGGNQNHNAYQISDTAIIRSDTVANVPDINDTIRGFSGFQLSLPTRLDYKNDLSHLESDPFTSPTMEQFDQQEALDSPQVPSAIPPRAIFRVDYPSDPFEDSPRSSSGSFQARIMDAGMQMKPSTPPELLDWLQPIPNLPSSLTARDVRITTPGNSAEPDFETEYHYYLNRTEVLTTETSSSPLIPNTVLLDEDIVLEEEDNMLTEKFMTSMNKDDISKDNVSKDEEVLDRTSTMPEIDEMLRKVAQENENMANQPLFWSDLRPVDSEVEAVLASMAAQEAITSNFKFTLETVDEPITTSPIEAMYTAKEEPETITLPSPSDDISAMVETRDRSSSDFERDLSPLRRNPQTRNITSLLFEKTSIAATEAQQEPETAASFSIPQQEPQAPPEIISREQRGRSMLRTADILEARSSYQANSKAANKSTERLIMERDRTSSPLRRNPVDISMIPVPTRDNTILPQRSLSTARSIKRRSRTLSPPHIKLGPPVTTSLNRTESPLRRNPVTPNQASLTPSIMERTESPLRRNPSTTPPRSVEVPPVSAPSNLVKEVARSMSQPRPNSNVAFSQTLSNFRNLAVQNTKEVSLANSEVTQRAIAGIYIPGSLREQAVGNLSKSREKSNGRDRR